MLPCSITKKWLRVPQGGLLKVISQADTLNDSYYFTRTTNSEWTNFASLKLKTKFLSHQPPIHSFSWCLFFHNERLNLWIVTVLPSNIHWGLHHTAFYYIIQIDGRMTWPKVELLRIETHVDWKWPNPNNSVVIFRMPTIRSLHWLTTGCIQL